MAEKKIGELDRNLASGAAVSDGLRFYDVMEPPFRLYGLMAEKEDGRFCRMPKERAEAVSEGVASLAFHTSGGRVRFASDAARIAVRVKLKDGCVFSHMPLTGTCGFSLYRQTGAGQRFVHTFVPPEDIKDGYEATAQLTESGMRDYTLYFPLYSGVEKLEIGAEAGAAFGPGLPYSQEKPVVFYGSSITQGGCASVSGNSYPAFLSRRYDFDFRNLGFSGNARGELAMAEYIAGLDMSVFVCDYDHNAPTAEHLERTLRPFLSVVRKAQRELPILLVSRPVFDPGSPECVRRRSAVFDAYRQAVEAGDSRIRFVDGAGLFAGQDGDACTVDGTHPNDLGMYRMANGIGAALEEFLR